MKEIGVIELGREGINRGGSLIAICEGNVIGELIVVVTLDVTTPVSYSNENVDTWIPKVGDFLYLTEANSRQQVAYAVTLLQEAVADLWAALLHARSRRCPEDWAEFICSAWVGTAGLVRRKG